MKKHSNPVGPQREETTQMIEANRWHESSLMETVETILGLIRSSWSWSKNCECKYVTIRIDMRDGAYVILDRNGKRIGLEQVLWQSK